MSFGIFEAHQNIAEEIRSAERTKANVRSHDAKKKEEYVDDQSRCFLGVVKRFDATFLAKFLVLQLFVIGIVLLSRRHSAYVDICGIAFSLVPHLLQWM